VQRGHHPAHAVVAIVVGSRDTVLNVGERHPAGIVVAIVVGSRDTVLNFGGRHAAGVDRHR
jgi:hypothetical protein